MKIKLDTGSQWETQGVDFIAIGFFNTPHLKSICLTMFGFWLDIDFIIEEEIN